MFKLLIVLGWGVFALDAFLAIVAVVSRNMGDDAAGRGAGLVLAGGAGLYFSGRAHSWPGAIASIVPLALPLLLFFGTDVEAYIHKLRAGFEGRKEGRYAGPAQRELANAIPMGDFESMRRILATHPNLNGRDEAGNDLLSSAASQTQTTASEAERTKSVEGVRLLLEAGMDPNASRESNGSSTFAGVSHGSSRPTGNGWAGDPAATEVFRLFLEHGANPNIMYERQPLIFGIWANLDSLNAALDHGADIDIRDSAGDTPLLFHLFNGRWDAALLVLQRGADIDVVNQSGTTPETALANGKRIVEEIHQKPLPDSYYKVKTALERRRAEAR